MGAETGPGAIPQPLRDQVQGACLGTAGAAELAQTKRCGQRSPDALQSMAAARGAPQQRRWVGLPSSLLIAEKARSFLVKDRSCGYSEAPWVDRAVLVERSVGS